jgi:hypothetical protein
MAFGIGKIKTFAADVAAAVEPIITQAKEEILNTMAEDQAALDAAIQNVNTAINKWGTDMQTALTDLQAKASAGQDFANEVNTLNNIASAAASFDAAATAADPGPQASSSSGSTPAANDTTTAAATDTAAGS